MQGSKYTGNVFDSNWCANEVPSNLGPKHGTAATCLPPIKYRFGSYFQKAEWIEQHELDTNAGKQLS